MKVLVGVNTLTAVNQYAYANHCQFWYRLGRNHPEIQFYFFTPPRMSIDKMRNTAAEVALKEKCDYLMFVDDDVLLPLQAFEKLLKADYDIIAGITVIRGYPFNMMFFKKDSENLVFYNDYVNFINSKTHIVDVDALGFSCVLIKCELLKKFEPPFFITGLNHTEDVYFCIKAVEALGRENIKMGVHCDVVTGHIGDSKIFTPDNISYYKDLEEFENPSLIVQETPKEALDAK